MVEDDSDSLVRKRNELIRRFNNLIYKKNTSNTSFYDEDIAKTKIILKSVVRKLK